MQNDRTFPRLGYFARIGGNRADGRRDVDLSEDQIYTGPERRRSQEDIRALAHVRFREMGRNRAEREKEK